VRAAHSVSNYEYDNIIGRSEAMQEIFATVARGALASASAAGRKSGVGKDLIALAIHFYSPRRDRPLVKTTAPRSPKT
jgi:two-component system nitrogen regulation response regulator GlnG